MVIDTGGQDVSLGLAVAAKIRVDAAKQPASAAR
jgi:hypothetical protein